MNRPRRSAWLAVTCGALLCGCTLSLQRAGDDRFLSADADWTPGATTTQQVAQHLGPPDFVRWSDERLVFVYRFQQTVRTSFALTFYLNIFSRDQAGQVDTTLVVEFDANDRLLWWGASDAAPAAPLTRMGLR